MNSISTMPGFTAESSLYQVREHYRAETMFIATVNGPQVIQQRRKLCTVTADCLDICPFGFFECYFICCH
jgi:hypothetical protein